MKNYRLYGSVPYKMAVIHGGPGDAGGMAKVATQLSEIGGVIEPLQTAFTVKDQSLELQKTLLDHADVPVILIGYSWGALLSLVVAAENLKLVQKLILVGCPPLEEGYEKAIMDARMSRLSLEEREKFSDCMAQFQTVNREQKQALFKELKSWIDKAEDKGRVIEHDDSDDNFQLDIFESIMAEMLRLRKEGYFVDCAKQISCPVVFFHGELDPHPLEAVKKAASLIKGSRIDVLKNCGHTPWIERDVKELFYRMLSEEVKG